MERISKVFAGLVLALVAAAMVPSAKGQLPITKLGMPTYTLTGIKVGTAPDGTQYKTVLWRENVSAGDWSYTVMAIVDQAPVVDPVTGSLVAQAVMVTWTHADGSVNSGAGANGGPNQYGADSSIVSGYPDNTIPVQTLNVQIWCAYGYAITALVEHFDASGTNLLERQVTLTDSQLLLPTVTTRFTLGLNDPTAMAVIVRNTGSDVANVTFAAYDSNPSSTNRTPFATATVQVPAGGKFCHLVGEVFSSFADAQNQAAFASDYAGPDGGNGTGFIQGVLAVSADQPISVDTVLFNTESDGSLLTTVWYAFPSVPTNLAISATQGFNPSLAFPYEPTFGLLNEPGDSYLLLYGKFGTAQGTIVVDGMTTLPTSAIAYWGAGQINVNLTGLPPLAAGNHSVLVTANGMASAPSWLIVATQ